MPGILPPRHIDPSLRAGSTLAGTELLIRFTTFEDAQTPEKHFSDSFIDGALTGKFQIGSEQVGTKGYLDKVEATPADNDIIADPKAIAGLYVKTTEMLARNLKIMYVSTGDIAKDGARKSAIRSAKETFLTQTLDEVTPATQQIIDWCNSRTNRFPVHAMEHHGLEIDGKDALDADSIHADDFRPNIKIMRQLGGSFVTAYSDNKIVEKLAKQEQQVSKRIYLNPDASVTPEIFEQVLVGANQAGLSIQLKMFQRAPEFAEAHLKRATGEKKDALRGDGIIISFEQAQANAVLAMVLSIARDNPTAFIGRKTSKIPQNVAEGVAVGDDKPLQMNGESLTSHRLMILNYAARCVQESGKTGKEARSLYRRYLVATAKSNNVNPEKVAFNTEA